jgi:hypothetical protein
MLNKCCRVQDVIGYTTRFVRRADVLLDVRKSVHEYTAKRRRVFQRAFGPDGRHHEASSLQEHLHHAFHDHGGQ